MTPPTYRCAPSTLTLASELERLARECRRIAETPCPKAMLERAEANAARIRSITSDARMAFRGEIAKARASERKPSLALVAGGGAG